MILGESHYTKDPLTNETTQIVVRDMLAPTPVSAAGKKEPVQWKNAFHRTVGLFNKGVWTDMETRRQFWSSVVFYNFIQVKVGELPRTRPTPEMWLEAAKPCEEVVATHKPDFVLVWGKDLWGNLPPSLNQGTEMSPTGQTAICTNGDCSSFLFGIKHPSSFGWRYDHWTPLVVAATEAANRLNPASNKRT